MEELAKSSPGVGATLRKFAPPPALCGFVLLLALVFTASYAFGVATGPVAPGMQRPGTSGDADRGDTHDMDHMDHGSGGR